MKEIEKPVGDFIMDNATGVQGGDGVYYHSEVKTVKKEEQSKVKLINDNQWLIINWIKKFTIQL
jgi:hypothetical protein